MSDLRGQQLKDSYQNLVTRGTGSKLEDGNGVEFADLDDKASLSDESILAGQPKDDVDITGGKAVGLNELSGGLKGGYQESISSCPGTGTFDSIALNSNVSHFHGGFVCSAGATRSRTINLTGLPTKNGSLLFLTVHVDRTNTDGSNRQTVFSYQLDGEVFYDNTEIISGGTNIVFKVGFMVIKTSNGWRRVGQIHEEYIES